MFAFNPRTDIVFRALLIAVILFNAFAPSAAQVSTVQAQGPEPTQTETPVGIPTETPTGEPTVAPTETSTAEPTVIPTETPNPITETATPLPTITETETPVPTGSHTGAVTQTATVASNVQAAEPVLSLTTEPDVITPGGNLLLNWELSGISLEGHEFILQITLPEGLFPKDKQDTGFDETTRTLTIPVEALTGGVHLEASDVGNDATITAQLLEGTAVITTASLFVPAREQFVVDKSGGVIEAQGGKIKVEFPADALPERAVVQVGRPSGDDRPPYSLLGIPFEITARGEESGQELKQFSKELSIFVSYADLNILEEQESQLYLYWYSPDTKEWKALPTTINKKTKTLHAITDHFTVFDININYWQASHLPTVDAFQVSTFTGAGTYSLPIQVPAGPGGLQPNLTLSYNSEVVDQASLAMQASWVGMGWSLDTGSIEMDTHGSDAVEDDTYLLNVGGISTRIVKDTSGVYHAADENFWKFTSPTAGNSYTWSVQDKQGNTYYFEKKLDYPYQAADCETSWTTYHWMLTKVRNIFGQEILYTYQDQITPTLVWYTDFYGCHTNWNYPQATATYPQYITYAGGRYRVEFTLNARLDYTSDWDLPHVFHAYEKFRLGNIYIKQDLDANGVYETTLRRYEFAYKANSDSDVIFPGYTWSAGDKTTTLKSVQEFGVGGTTGLPLTTFTYGDNLHLTKVDNGYGGSVEFSYDSVPWYYQPHASGSHTNLDKFGQPYNPCSNGAYHGPEPWVGASCSQMRLAIGGAYDPEYNNTRELVRPGGMYKLSTIVYYQTPGSTLQLGLRNGATDNYATPGLTEAVLQLPATASVATPLINASGFTQLSTFKFELLTSIYRVTQKRVKDGNNHTYTYTYSYNGAAVNDTTISSGVCGFTVDPTYNEIIETPGCLDYFPKFSEFRGHAQVTETEPDGTQTITQFYQDDVLKGRPISVTAQAGSQNLSQANYSYASTPLSIYAYYWPYTGNYVGLRRDWIYTSALENRIYANNGTYTANRQVLSCETTYGNLTTQTDQSWNGSAWVNYRTTTIDYFPNTGSVYLVSLPARQQIKNANNTVIAESLNIYDSNSTYNQMPTVGKLSAVRTWVSGTQYSQATFGYDAWGNQTTVNTYSGYGTASATPTTSARTITTAFDRVFHVYPVSQTTPPTANVPAGLVTTWIYDYDGNSINDFILGVPTLETDPNGNPTSAQYDIFGRMTKLIRPGDSTASPTLTMAYQDSFPFTTTGTQKIDSTKSYTVQRVYDGMGRQTKITSGGSIVDTIYQSPTVTRQSMPYVTGETIYYTTTTVNPSAHTVTVAAPDGTSTITTTNGLAATLTDARNNSTTTTKDVWGRVVSVAPPTGPGVTYTYDELDHLKTATRGGVTMAMKYDNAGRKIGMDDPDMGTLGTTTDDNWAWTYQYDALGNLTSQTDARSCALTLGYDNLNRLLSKSSSGAGCGTQISATYSYDAGTNGKGFRTGMTDASGSASWTYDTRGRMASESKIITGATTFNTSWTYNSADLPITMTYPDGEVVNYNYNNRMLLDSVIGTSTYVSSTTYDSAGRMDVRAFGNGTQTNYDYFPWNAVAQGSRLQYLKSGTAATPTSLQSLEYAYDAVGNVDWIKDWKAGSPQLQDFGYDALDRLTSAVVTGGTGGTYNESYTYNATTGNLATKGSQTYTYDAVHAHAVASQTNGYNYQYDANGNMTRRVIGVDTYDLADDAENHLVQVKQNNTVIATFTYDGDGKRVTAAISGFTTVRFVGQYYEYRSSSNVTKYYYAGAQRLAMSASGAMSYILGDHLGSTAITTDASGVVTSELRYRAFGAQRYSSGTVPTKYRFTGQYSHTTNFDLYYYGARWYDPYLNHFTQPDSIVPDQYNSQDWDRYAYARYSPIRYTDPSGHIGCDDQDENGKCINYEQNLLRKISKNYSDWERQILRKLFNEGGADAMHGVFYIVDHNIHINIGTGWQSGFGSRSGWFDESTNTVTLNYDSLDNFVNTNNRTLSGLTPWGYSVIIHEALHLEQGSALSHSVEGERLAWQAGLRVYKNLISSAQRQREFAPGTDYQNILEDTTPKDFIDDMWAPFYVFTMQIAYPMYPGDSVFPLFPNCGTGGYCPPLAGR